MTYARPSPETTGLRARLVDACATLQQGSRSGNDLDLPGEAHKYLELLHEAHDALLENDARFAEHSAVLDEILRNGPECIAYIDLSERIQWINWRYGRTGVLDGKSTQPGKHWLELVPSEHRATLALAFEQVVKNGTSVGHETSERQPDGRIVWTALRLSALRADEQIVGVVLVARDATEAKNAELQLMVGDRMTSMGTLAAGVAHEINNPLAAVITNLELVCQRLRWIEEPKPHQIELFEQLDDARSSAYRVRAIVRDLKLFSRGDDPRAEAIDVESILDSTIRVAWNQIRHRTQLVKRYGMPRLAAGNASRLGQVFLNLLMNAAQSIPEGHSAENEIEVATFENDAGEVVVEIADTGCGIPDGVARRLFTPFFTTKAVGDGTGLGLSISRRIVESLGGTISFRSRPGGGTVFTVRLLSAPDALVSKATRVSQPEVARPSRRGRVLIVDDEVMFGLAVERLLKDEHETSFVDTGRAALERLARGEVFDVILCDLMMPDLTGMDLHAEVQRFSPQQASSMVFVSGGAFSPRAIDFLASTKNRMVDKPFVPDELRDVVNSLIR